VAEIYTSTDEKPLGISGSAPPAEPSGGTARGPYPVHRVKLPQGPSRRVAEPVTPVRTVPAPLSTAVLAIEERCADQPEPDRWKRISAGSPRDEVPECLACDGEVAVQLRRRDLGHDARVHGLFARAASSMCQSPSAPAVLTRPTQAVTLYTRNSRPARSAHLTLAWAVSSGTVQRLSIVVTYARTAGMSARDASP
jgi:hypothetical protein